MKSQDSLQNKLHQHNKIQNTEQNRCMWWENKNFLKPKFSAARQEPCSLAPLFYISALLSN